MGAGSVGDGQSALGQRRKGETTFNPSLVCLFIARKGEKDGTCSGVPANLACRPGREKKRISLPVTMCVLGGGERLRKQDRGQRWQQREGDRYQLLHPSQIESSKGTDRSLYFGRKKRKRVHQGMNSISCIFYFRMQGATKGKRSYKPWGKGTIVGGEKGKRRFVYKYSPFPQEAKGG